MKCIRVNSDGRMGGLEEKDLAMAFFWTARTRTQYKQVGTQVTANGVSFSKVMQHQIT